MKVIAIIPARSGSKGLKNKNLKKIKSKTLLELAISVGLNCESITDVFVSTDSHKYEKIAKNAGAQSLGLRHSKLSGDHITTSETVHDLLRKIDESYDFIVLLQPTSPVRCPKDIDNILSVLSCSDVDACVSMSYLEEPHPYKLKQINKDGYVIPFINGKTSEAPRQSMPKVLRLNGAIYAVDYKKFMKYKTFLPKKTRPYLMDTCINIDTEEDFLILKALYDLEKIKIYGI